MHLYKHLNVWLFWLRLSDLSRGSVLTDDVSAFMPRYRVIANELRQKIFDGQYAPNECLPSESKLMEVFDVSRGTVRGALDLLDQEQLLQRWRGKGTFVTARGRAMQTTLVFAYPGAYSLRHPYLSGLYHSFEEGVRDFHGPDGGDISVQCIRQAKTAVPGSFTLLGAEDPFQTNMIDPRHVQGLCLTTSLPEHELVEIQRRGISCVELDGTAGSRVPTVYLDRLASKKLAIEHLMRLGHRSIGMVVVDHPDPVGEELQAEIVKLGRGRGLNMGQHCRAGCADWQRELASAEVKKLLSGAQRPTALLCFDDILALGARDAATCLGIAVPDDLSIVGFGDYVPDAGLTTVKPALEQLGRKGAEMLTKLVLQSYEGPRHVCLDDCELIVRESTGPAPL